MCVVSREVRHGHTRKLLSSKWPFAHFESHNSVLMSVSCYCLELFDVFVMVNIVRMLHSIEPRV
jgi:hypothetical protein